MVSGGLYVRLYRCLNSECGVRNAELMVSASPMIEKLGYAFVQFQIFKSVPEGDTFNSEFSIPDSAL